MASLRVIGGIGYETTVNPLEHAVLLCPIATCEQIYLNIDSPATAVPARKPRELGTVTSSVKPKTVPCGTRNCG